MQDIYITRDQKVFFGPDELIDRAALLDTMAYGYDASFSDAEKERFMELRFIPVEPGNNQLKYWIGSIRKVKPKSRFYVYADRDTPYSSLKKILDALNEAGVPRISMVADTK